MTLDQLRALVDNYVELARNLHQISSRFLAFMLTIQNTISSRNPFVNNIVGTQEQVDAFIATQSPLYNGHLHDIEVAADALGTDPFNP